MKQAISSKIFAPVTLTLTFETQVELDAFGALANFSPLVDAMKAIGGKHIQYDLMESAGASMETEKLKLALQDTPWMKNLTKRA